MLQLVCVYVYSGCVRDYSVYVVCACVFLCVRVFCTILSTDACMFRNHVYSVCGYVCIFVIMNVCVCVCVCRERERERERESEREREREGKYCVFVCVPVIVCRCVCAFVSLCACV